MIRDPLEKEIRDPLNDRVDFARQKLIWARIAKSAKSYLLYNVGFFHKKKRFQTSREARAFQIKFYLAFVFVCALLVFWNSLR